MSLNLIKRHMYGKSLYLYISLNTEIDQSITNVDIKVTF